MIYFGLRADDTADEDLFEGAHGTAANCNRGGERVDLCCKSLMKNDLQLDAREGIEPTSADAEGACLGGDCKTSETAHSQPDAQEKGNVVLWNGAILADLLRTWDKYPVELKRQVLEILTIGGPTR